MKTYIGTKIVRAEPEARSSDGKKPKVEGYRVEYADGYYSWSPKDVFEIAYRPVEDDEAAMVLKPETNPRQ